MKVGDEGKDFPCTAKGGESVFGGALVCVVPGLRSWGRGGRIGGGGLEFLTGWVDI